MMESAVMGNYHAAFGERDRETRAMQVEKVRPVPTPLSPLLCNIFLHQLDKYMEHLGANRGQTDKEREARRNPEYAKIQKRIINIGKKLGSVPQRP
jgi:hypothetical protein